MEPQQLLLIIILFAGPDDRPVAEALADAIQQQSTTELQVAVGNERLVEFGLQRADLLATPSLGSHLTRLQSSVILVDLDYRAIGGQPRIVVGDAPASTADQRDHMIEAQLWMAGQYDVFTTIAGAGGDPVPGLIDGVMPLLQPVLQVEPQAVQVVDVPLATLVQRQEWTKVLTRLAAQQGPETAIEYYYQVSAYSALNNRQAALESLNHMRENFGGHFLVMAATEALPPVRSEPQFDTIDAETAELAELEQPARAIEAETIEGTLPAETTEAATSRE